MPDLMSSLRHALDPVAFAVERLGFDPDEWQREFLRSTSAQALLLCTRQAGKSTASALLALHTALYRSQALVLLLSPSQRQSGLLFRKMQEFRQRLVPVPELVEDNALSCMLGNGSRVVSLPGTEETIRGFSRPDLILVDEAARVPAALYRSIRPMRATNPHGRLAMLTSAYGQQGPFYEEWTLGDGSWHRIEVPASRVPRISPEFLANERRSLGEAWYRQEYECQFMQAAGQVFDPADIARAMTDEVVPLFGRPVASEDVIPLFPQGAFR